MKFRLLGPALATAAVAATTLVGGVAVAQTPTAVAAAKPNCDSSIVNVPAKESVKIRTSPKLSATAVGLWAKGKKGALCSDGKSFKGQKYKLCGKTSDRWLYGGPFSSRKEGYVPAACIKW
ncbi:hypothetical protein [Streptomyces sp. G45]|uniref:hypothetical protein n=1 Tax=Streptomyces sp. G45 TaxID=3406627 RepID=UPI003C173219